MQQRVVIDEGFLYSWQTDVSARAALVEQLFRKYPNATSLVVSEMGGTQLGVFTKPEPAPQSGPQPEPEREAEPSPVDG